MEGYMTIGIVDDKEEDLEVFSNKLRERLDISDNIRCYTHPEEIKLQINELDVVFMDVQMPEKDGISLAKELLDINSKIILVFLSDYDSYVWDSFAVDAIYYMRKRFFEKELGQVIKQINDKFIKRKKDYSTIKVGNKIYNLNLRNILYVEAQQKDVRIVTRDGDIKIRYRISSLEKELEGFIKIHRSYLVNPIYVKSVKEREWIMENDESLPVSKYRREEVRQEYLSFLSMYM
ncbi:MAG: response regulator [Lachnospiraceae bacterium]|jgi:DNA-binding LytR/AlgR family response regulator|nr:response regulator [Lachnospiraceae bacterium]